MKKRKWQLLFGLIFLTGCLAVFCSGREENRQETDEEMMLPFAEEANANLDIQRAIEKATQTHKKILLILGANRNDLCKKFYRLIESDGEVRFYFKQAFEPVWIDMGQQDRNRQIDAKYGHPAAKYGIPVFVILDSNGNFIATQKIDPFTASAPENEPANLERQKLLNFFIGWSSGINV